MRLSLITKIVQDARGMIERALVRKGLKKPRLSQNPPIPEVKLKNILKKSRFESNFEVQEADAFRMKAISLLQPHKFYSTIQEKISSLQLAPLFTQEDNEKNQITLSQVLLPFPGERIELKGTFQRNDNRTIPVANSFQLHRISNVTGFPHPAQHAGWAFSDAFIDDKNQLENIRKELVPGERLRQNAKDWVGAKKRVFDKHKNELCPYLKRLMEAIHGDSSPVIDAFFEQAMMRGDCYDFLCVTHAKILENRTPQSEALSSYQKLILGALNTQNATHKICAEFELQLFVECLKIPPPDEQKLFVSFKDSINNEIHLLINS